MASRKEQKERLRAERVKREAADRQKEQRRRLIQYGSGAAFLAVCVVAVLIIISQSGGGGSSGDVSAGEASAVDQELKGIPQHDTVLGDPKAKVTVIEYGDLQCPVCQQFSFNVAPGLISGPVKDGTADYEFRQWTIIGPDSIDAASAALAAAEQNRYWNFIQLFYRNQGTENSGYAKDPSFLESIAKAAGVPDMNKWNQDRQTSKWTPELKRINSEAQGFGFSGTPSIVVKGPKGTKPLPTIPTIGDLEAVIKQVE
jgi:protein-disulfide isomerase